MRSASAAVQARNQIELLKHHSDGSPTQFCPAIIVKIRDIDIIDENLALIRRV